MTTFTTSARTKLLLAAVFLATVLLLSMGGCRVTGGPDRTREPNPGKTIIILTPSGKTPGTAGP